MVMPCGATKDSGQHDKNAENGHCAFEDLDHSILQQPLNLGVTNVKQILKCIQSGSREVKDIILNECNIIYECKVCVGLFRSLANFMYHKRCYCKKHLCEEMVLFENFEEESQKVIVQPEAPNESAEKISEENKNGPKIVECTVDLVKTDLPQEKISPELNDIHSTPEVPSLPKEEIMSTSGNKGKIKSLPEVKKFSEAEKVENSMVSRRTRDKNIQNAQTVDSLKILKNPSHEEPPAKCAKVTPNEAEDNKTSSDETKNSTTTATITNPSKEVKSDKTDSTNCTSVIEKSPQSFPKIIFKSIDGNPHAVFQSTEKMKSENINIKTKFENSSLQTKVDNEKLIIVLKKDVKIQNTPISKSELSDKQNKELEKQNEFHLTRRKRLLTRNDCSVHELKCLVCKTQFMSLKTLYFHMLSLHSKKRLYYPCPFCKTLFVQMYGVTRHLVSIHNKTKEQINKLREVIKKKSVWKRVDDVNPSNETCPSTMKTESYDFKQESQQENKVESLKRDKGECDPPIKTIIKIGKNVTLHQCSKCNRVFGRKSSQVSHEKFCIMNAIKVETVDLTTTQPTSPPPVVSFLSLSPKQPTIEQSMAKLIQPPKQVISDMKVSIRPKRGAEKQMHKDFVNSQTLKWRSANRVDTHSKPIPSSKKNSGKNLEKKVLSIMNVENLLCLKCDKRFSSYSNLRRHVAIHVGWTRFECKFCDYQAYNKSQCWTHVQKSHSVPDSEMEKSIINLVSNNLSSKKSIASTQVAQSTKRSPEASIKTSTCKNNTIPKMKISKKKNANISIRNISPEKKHSQINKKECVDNKKDLHESKKDSYDKNIQDNKKDTYDNKKEVHDSKKDKNQLPTHVLKCSVPEYKKETTNYKSVTTSNPTTIILSKKIPSSAVQSIVTISSGSVSSTSPSKTSSVRSSPRKNEPKVPGEKTITSLVTRSNAYMKNSPIQIKLPARSSSIEEIKKDQNPTEKTYGKKDRLISEWFPKKDLTSNNTRRDSAPLIIGLVPASSSGLNARTKNPGIAFERNSS